MKNLLNLLMLFILVSSTIFMSSCEKETTKPPPTATFTFTGDNNPAPCAVTFINSSTNATSYSWDFGDGTPLATEQNPQHTYTTGGTFNVILKATGEGGSNTANKSVTIKYPIPGANFTFTGNTNPAPCTVTFTNISTNSTSYSWDFGDNTPTSTEQNPQHIYAVGGTYIVQLTVTGKGGSASVSKSVIIQHPVPVADFTFSGDNNFAPCTVTFTNYSTNATSYLWNFGDGGSSTEKNPQHTYTAGGTFYVQLTAISQGGNSTITKTVVILNPTTSTNVTFNNEVYTNIYITINGNTQTITPGNSVTFYSLPGSSASYSAYTYGATTTGTQIGLELNWDNTISLPGGSISYNLIFPDTYFFLYITNEGTHDLTPLYVNYGLSQQTQDNILIPNDHIKYRTGYYYAFSSTVVRAYYQDSPNSYTYWYNLNFPWTNNQSISLVNTYKKSPGTDEGRSFVSNPQYLIPAGNEILHSQKHENAIDVPCK